MRHGHGLHTVSPKLPRNAKKSGYILVVLRTYPNVARTPYPKNSLEMLGNMPASLTWPDTVLPLCARKSTCVPDMACTPRPEID
ncbi:Hypothetical predicted protein [Olea europaea subsp. europaea]|uniref:Uncharacterized protein n=1 Tax=Olea europaea subsp. europaea TaxID=158383 RepID=A0A8S0UVZ8_OLEEU|nr:Hypothetical predicted protein [Olea europaea subsp. europaea]